MMARWLSVVVPMLAVLALPLTAHAEEVPADEGDDLPEVMPVSTTASPSPSASPPASGPHSGTTLVAIGAGLFVVGYGGGILLATNALTGERRDWDSRSAIPIAGPAFVSEEWGKSVLGLWVVGSASVAQVAGLATLGIGVHQMTKAPRVVVAPNGRGLAVAGEF